MRCKRDRTSRVLRRAVGAERLISRDRRRRAIIGGGGEGERGMLLGGLEGVSRYCLTLFVVERLSIWRLVIEV